MYDGILLIDKPADWTSHDVVAKVRGILNNAQRQDALATQESRVQGTSEKHTEPYKEYGKGASELVTQQFASSQSGVSGSASKQGLAVRRPRVKVGHTGTLDPFATGLLILVVGSYTKRAGEFSGMDKTYDAEMILGATSETGDIEGQISSISDIQPTKQELEAVFSQFKGRISQMPHKYSAKKINGQKAYNLARAGKEVKLEPKEVTIYELRITNYEYPKVKFTAKVSSGTYIRSLAEDMGAKLGTGAYLSALRRTSVGEYKVEDASNIDKNA